MSQLLRRCGGGRGQRRGFCRLFQGLRMRCRYAAGAEGGAVSQLLDDVVAAGVERCTEPILLEGHILDRLAAATQPQP